MKSGERSGEEPAEKRENLGEKLRRERVLLGKRGGQSTPSLPPWRLQLHHNSSPPPPPPSLPSVSARKLAATLWELHHYNLPLSKMNHGHRRHHHHHRLQQHRHLYKDKGLDGDGDGPDPSTHFPDQPDSASSLRRHVAASLMMQRHRSAERSNHAIQPASPASYESSMEMAPYNPAVTPTSSVEFKGRIGETSYSLKTSTELLKVLNRIWSLEEQHAANISLVKAMKKELDHARAKIKELIREQQSDRHEIDELMKRISEDKLIRKSKEQDRINSAVQSARDELEEERRLRKRSETLHRKLARELQGVKSSFSSAMKEIEIERKSRVLLEDLCDEFAWGIRDYEQELHGLRQKSEKNRARNDDRMILHISESWLDQRMQMKAENESGLRGRDSVVENLRSEIEGFLQAKQRVGYKINDNAFRRSSLESIPLNLTVSAPRNDDDDDDDDSDDDSRCFEINKQKDESEEAQIDKLVNFVHSKKKIGSFERVKELSPTRLQVKFEEQMALVDDDKQQLNSTEKNPIENEITISRKSEICEEDEEDDGLETKKKGNFGIASSCGTSAWRSCASPVRQWTSRLPSQDLDTCHASESSSKLPPPDLKQDTLKSKLIEARTRGQKARSRLKPSKISF